MACNCASDKLQGVNCVLARCFMQNYSIKIKMIKVQTIYADTSILTFPFTMLNSLPIIMKSKLNIVLSFKCALYPSKICMEYTCTIYNF